MIRLEQFDSKQYTFPHTCLKSEHDASDYFHSKYYFFSNGLSGNTITFPMLSMQKRYCSNVLGSKSHSSNLCAKLHTFQILLEKNQYFSNVWGRAMMFFGGFGQNQIPFDSFGQKYRFFSNVLDRTSIRVECFRYK